MSDEEEEVRSFVHVAIEKALTQYEQTAVSNDLQALPLTGNREMAEDLDRMPCPTCSRTFAPSVLCRHAPVCAASAARAEERRLQEAGLHRPSEQPQPYPSAKRDDAATLGAETDPVRVAPARVVDLRIAVAVSGERREPPTSEERPAAADETSVCFRVLRGELSALELSASESGQREDEQREVLLLAAQQADERQQGLEERCIELMEAAQMLAEQRDQAIEAMDEAEEEREFVVRQMQAAGLTHGQVEGEADVLKVQEEDVEAAAQAAAEEEAHAEAMEEEAHAREGAETRATVHATATIHTRAGAAEAPVDASTLEQEIMAAAEAAAEAEAEAEEEAEAEAEAVAARVRRPPTAPKVSVRAKEHTVAYAEEHMELPNMGLGLMEALVTASMQAEAVMSLGGDEGQAEVSMEAMVDAARQAKDRQRGLEGRCLELMEALTELAEQVHAHMQACIHTCELAEQVMMKKKSSLPPLPPLPSLPPSAMRPRGRGRRPRRGSTSSRR